jgi:hypothetical protein
VTSLTYQNRQQHDRPNNAFSVMSVHDPRFDFHLHYVTVDLSMDTITKHFNIPKREYNLNKDEKRKFAPDRHRAAFTL